MKRGDLPGVASAGPLAQNAPMASPSLPDLSLEVFSERLHGRLPALEAQVVERLYAHYQELARWNRKLSLIGPGTVGEVVERHYVESLLALRFLDDKPLNVLDIGSGAGFPGLILAAALPSWRLTLIESRQKKWAFLESAIRAMRLSARALNARVGGPLPAGFPDRVDMILLRAVAPSERLFESVRASVADQTRLLLWTTDRPIVKGFSAEREVPVPGTESRRIVELVRGDARSE